MKGPECGGVLGRGRGGKGRSEGEGLEGNRKAEM